MTFKELKTIISSGEGERQEVKETTGQRVDACETLCAFLNKDGGTGVLGDRHLQEARKAMSLDNSFQTRREQERATESHNHNGGVFAQSG